MVDFSLGKKACWSWLIFLPEHSLPKTSQHTAASKGDDVTADGVTEMLTDTYISKLFAGHWVRLAQMIICFNKSSGRARLRSAEKAADVTTFDAGRHVASFPWCENDALPVTSHGGDVFGET